MKQSLALLSLACVWACTTTAEDADADAGAEPSPSASARVDGGGGADVLPTAAVSAFVAGVETFGTRGDDELVVVEVSEVSSDSIYKDALDDAKARGEGGIDVAVQSANELVVLLRRDLTTAEAEGALRAIRALPYDCEPSKTMPQIGALVVLCSDLQGTDGGISPAVARTVAINKAVETLRADERFAAVSADTILSSTSIVTAMLPESDRSGEEMGEQSDWGIAASNIQQVWPLLTRQVEVGVIDAGFANHPDLPIANQRNVRCRADGLDPENHGNHVAGIMCARHNGVGVKGVLPNCKVTAATGEFLLRGPSALEGSGVNAWQARFSEYMGTVLDFMEANPDAKVINLSLGYNWMPNRFGDPRQVDRVDWRDTVKGQGSMFQRILAYAKKRDIAVFSAAGNDSTNLSTPLEAEWASPFNYGAKLMKDTDGWSNGVVVEAYGSNNRRAVFSNASGAISCPGVEVKSAIACPSGDYGVMGGTSMASPYCAAGFAALRSLLPQVSMQRALQCYLGVSGRVSGVPKMDLKAAFEACRP